MKKKLVLVVIILIIGIILFLENVCKISIVDSAKNLVGWQAKLSYNEENNKCTVIDVTYLEDRGSIGHDHTFKTVYDENEHWSECTVCGEKNGVGTHIYKTTWASGIESCEKNNYYTKTCTCGYSYTGHKPCRWDGKSYEFAGDDGAYSHTRVCSVCNGCIEYLYYGTDNKLYSAEYKSNAIESTKSNQKCTSSKDGSILDCNNFGTCSVCKSTVNKVQHTLNVNDNNEIYCSICNNKYGTSTIRFKEISTAPATFEVTSEVNLTNGARFSRVGNVRNVGQPYKTTSLNVSNKSSDGTSYILNGTAIFKPTWKNPYDTYITSLVTINGVVCRLGSNYYSIFLSPDSIKPEITSVKMKNDSEELTEWSRTKPIIISGIENYCDTVNVKILDENGDVVFSGGGNVANNKFSISCIPELELDANGKTFTAIVTDSCENSTTQEFKIAKVDAKAPVAISDKDITGEWARSRKFTFKAVDEGIGEISIAFNDIKDLELANFDGTEYARDYEFVGDVYSPKELSVLYKDGLGNTSIQKVTIDKIDNTAPTIVSANVHNNVVNIEANDDHTSLGKGSGIVKYRYITSSEKLDNPVFSSGIEVDVDEKMVIDDIYKVKYIYIVAEDAAKNVSKVYELKVPELILTSKVDLSLANGKGGIILDWSDYDISDKYFVIYRREENQSDWKEIVSLDDKLCDNKYTDIMANDKNKPTIPMININGNAENNNIKVEASSLDNGSKYSYYIEAYDINGILVQKASTN